MTDSLRELAARQLRKSADARDQNRRDFPECARVMDLLSAFEPRVIYVEEGGKSRGKSSDDEPWITWPDIDFNVPRGTKVEKYKRAA